MAAPKISKTKPKAGLAPLPPEAAAALQDQMARVAAACAAGQDLEALKDLVSANSEDLLWDLHLMASLGNILHPAIPPLLAARFGGAPDKARRKALKRVLHLLKTRGVPVPGDLLPREEPAFGPVRPPAVKSTISPILGNGDAYLVLEGPKEILGGNFLVAILNDAAGLQECHLLNMKSRQQTEFWDHYRQHGLTEWYPVPGPYAVRLLEEAYRPNRGDCKPNESMEASGIKSGKTGAAPRPPRTWSKSCRSSSPANGAASWSTPANWPPIPSSKPGCRPWKS